MSKRSDGAASAESIEDAFLRMAQPARKASKMRFCEWRGKLLRNLPERDGRISCLHENSPIAGHEGSASL